MGASLLAIDGSPGFAGHARPLVIVMAFASAFAPRSIADANPCSFQTDLSRAQARSSCGTCDKVTRRANHPKSVQPFRQKYFRCPVGQIRSLTPPVSRDERGARDRHERAERCGGRDGGEDERCCCVRRNRLGPTPRCWRQVRERLTLRAHDGVKKAGHQDDYV
jgi:hypothetical protein